MLTVKQVAERLRISASLVYSWCEDHLLPHYRMGGKGKRGNPDRRSCPGCFPAKPQGRGQAGRCHFPRSQAHYAGVAAFSADIPSERTLP
jgi:excisionase family DNA binding protein